MALAPAFTTSDGSFRFTDTPTEGGEYTYTVRWYGATYPCRPRPATT